MNASRLQLQPPRYSRLNEVVRAFTLAATPDEVYRLAAECAHGITRSDQAVLYNGLESPLAPTHGVTHVSSPALVRVASQARVLGVMATGEARDDEEIQHSLADPIWVGNRPVAVVAVGRWSLPYGTEMPGRLRMVTIQAGRALARISGRAA